MYPFVRSAIEVAHARKPEVLAFDGVRVAHLTRAGRLEGRPKLTPWIARPDIEAAPPCPPEI